MDQVTPSAIDYKLCNKNKSVLPTLFMDSARATSTKAAAHLFTQYFHSICTSHHTTHLIALSKIHRSICF